MVRGRERGWGWREGRGGGGYSNRQVYPILSHDGQSCLLFLFHFFSTTYISSCPLTSTLRLLLHISPPLYSTLIPFPPLTLSSLSFIYPSSSPSFFKSSPAFTAHILCIQLSCRATNKQCKHQKTLTACFFFFFFFPPPSFLSFLTSLPLGKRRHGEHEW